MTALLVIAGRAAWALVAIVATLCTVACVVLLWGFGVYGFVWTLRTIRKHLRRAV